MKILLLGPSGQLGWELQRSLPAVGEVSAVGRPEIDLTDADSIRRILAASPAELIVNAAAYTDVDRAEDESELAWRSNAEAPGVMAEQARRMGAAFISYSSDYVFDGAKAGRYVETDAPNPLNQYGRSKLAGERAVAAVGGSALLLRTSWVYGSRGRNFLCTMLRLGQECDELRVVDDQIGAPTWSRAIANATAQIVQCALRRAKGWPGSAAEALRDYAGLYHLTAGGEVSWCGFAQVILRYRTNGHCAVQAIRSSESPARAARPHNSRLDNTKLRETFGVALPDWRASLPEVMRELGYELPPSEP